MAPKREQQGGKDMPGDNASVLAAAADGPHAERAAPLVELWEGWERGRTLPLDVARGLEQGGIEALRADLSGT